MENNPNDGTSKNDSARKPDQEIQRATQFNTAEYERWSAVLRNRQLSRSDGRMAT